VIRTAWEHENKKFVLFAPLHVGRPMSFMEWYEKGFVVDWAADYRDTTRKLSEAAYDAIVVDLSNSPDDGMALLKIIKSKPTSTKLVCLTPSLPQPVAAKHADLIVHTAFGNRRLIEGLTAMLNIPPRNATQPSPATTERSA
jgi:hypothetical protein